MQKNTLQVVNDRLVVIKFGWNNDSSPTTWEFNSQQFLQIINDLNSLLFG
jgi:hypothetical protein